MFVGDGLAERPGVDADRRHVARPIEREMRKHQLGEAIRLLEMRIAGHDEGIDADILILPDPRGDGWRITDQRGARAATHQTDAGQRLGLISSLSRRPPCNCSMRCWPTESMREKII